MIDYIKGDIAEITPTYVVLETAGIGYFVNIPLPVYSEINGKKSCKLFIYEAIREDAYNLFGFLSQADRELFLMLISVSGIGAATARMIMSSFSTQEIQQMIATEDVPSLTTIKGIGAKTAQRIIVDLKDKMIKLQAAVADDSAMAAFTQPSQAARNEAVSALTMLGFTNNASQKAVNKVLKKHPDMEVEELIKLALKNI